MTDFEKLAEYLDNSMIKPIDLKPFERGDDLTVLVRPANDFAAALHEHFRAAPDKKFPGMLWANTQNRIEFRPSEVSIWAGINGHRKSTMTSQVALDLCKQGEKVLVASLEMPAVRTLAKMVRQAYGDIHPTTDFINRFLAWATGKLWIFDHVGNLSPKSCLALCRYWSSVLKGGQIFIDSMMKIVQSEEHIDEQKKFANDLCGVAHETALHIHLVHHVRKGKSESDRPGKFDLKGSGAISDVSDNVFICWRDKECEEAHAKGEDLTDADFSLEVAKQRNGAFEGRLRFYFDSPSMTFLEKPGEQAMRYTLT